MRQRLLNGALAGALAGLFCLLAATAYEEVKQDDAEVGCASENHTLDRQAARCEICVVPPCESGAMTASHCAGAANCIIDGKVVSRDPKSKRIESRLRTGLQMQP